MSARVMQEVLRQTPAPTSGSMLSVVSAVVPEESAADWCRAFLVAALEHLVMWADYVTPQHMHPDAQAEFALRPAQTLARAALESASQAVWILSPTEVQDVERRYISLVLADWDEQKKAASGLDAKASMKKRRADALQRLGLAEDLLRTPSYLTLVRDATTHVRSQLPGANIGSAVAVERLWRASAGSAHGKKWPSTEMTVNWEEHGWRISLPDPAAITAILQLADKVTTYGVLRFAEQSGHHEKLADIQRAAMETVYGTVSKIPGAPAAPPRPPKV
jgi:hypothetical protein